MHFKLRFTTLGDWPRLAWLAACTPSAAEVTCYVGEGVEVTDDFWCEGVWPGAFGSGDFDRTDLFFGSGGCLRPEGVAFVSAGSTVDRLHSLDQGSRLLVSNSLPCLLATAGGALDLEFAGYEYVFNTVTQGLRDVVRDLPTTAGSVRLHYFEDGWWDGRTLTCVEKSDERRDFASYAKYRGFLDETMRRLAENAGSTERSRPLSLMATVSAGYDSPATTVLAKEVGCDEAIGFDVARDGADDSGERIAEILGVRYHGRESSAWRSAPGAVVEFLAGGAGNGADVIFKAAEPLLRERVLITGFHGDKMWDRNTDALGDDMVRSDSSGTDLTEYRLSAGFINCPVPFWGARQIKDVNAIARSTELSPWDVGGYYTRPIPRRMVEEAGVPRELFGNENRAACIDLLSSLGTFSAEQFLTADSREDYFRWLRSGRDANDPSGSGASVRRLGGVALQIDPETDFEHRRQLRRYVLHWAMDQAIGRYGAPEL